MLKFRVFSILFLIISTGCALFAQNNRKTYSLSGTVLEASKNTAIALPYATVAIPEYSQATTTNSNGKFALKNIPSGKFRLTVSFVGKVTIDTIISLSNNLNLNFKMQENNFRLKQVVITVEQSKTGQSTASSISRTAMEHLQATSLKDIMSLLPGGLSQNQNLNTASQFTIRSISSNTTNNNFNALGTAIVQDGAPLSNNANLQSMNPVVTGAVASLGGDASPAGGVDIRSISVENIESVEVIRGIPSVEYGDLTSGVVILNTKAGKEPVRIKGKSNINVYQLSASGGFDLGKNKGALNVGGDFAYNVNDPVQSYLHYQRATASVKYSNTFWGNLRSNTTFDFIYGKNSRDKNPDNLVTQTSSEGTTIGNKLNTNGVISINKGLLKTIKYVASVSYTEKKSFYEQLYTSANAPYSATLTDGAILSNKPNTDIYDKDGNKITNIGEEDKNNVATYLPDSYLARYDIDGKELSVYAKVNATFFKKINDIYNRLLVGVDFKSDGNLGKGKQFSSEYPPYRVLSAVNASFRERDYRDIPFMNQYSAYAEDNMNYTKKKFKARLQAGVRYDAYSEVGSIVTPRLNLAIDPLPDVLTLRGAYGVQAKAPTLLYVYPEKAYFEYVNINEMSSTTVPDNQKLFITTTRIFDTQNKDLKVATNKRFEVGIDLRIKNIFLELTGFSDKLANGYMLDNTVNTFKPLIYNEYKRTTDGIVLSQSNPVLAKFSTPTNHLVNNTKGLEFNLNLGRIDAIRTSISANGAWINSEVYNNDYYYYDDASGTGGKDRTHIGLYEKGMEKRYDENLITALRLTHNIPEIGFVVTLTMQTTWMDKNWYKYGNDSLPVKYISKLDGNVYDFDPAKKNDAEFKKLRRTPSTKNYIEESLPPLFCFNMNITKEIGDFMRVSFFANNLFRDYPIAESKRSPGTYYVRNGQFFFGLELSLYLKQFKL